MINLASLASEFTFFSPSYPVRGLMVDTSINPVAMPAVSIRNRDGASACHFTTPKQFTRVMTKR
jgi:hypothetical protein